MVKINKTLPHVHTVVSHQEDGICRPLRRINRFWTVRCLPLLPLNSSTESQYHRWVDPGGRWQLEGSWPLTSAPQTACHMLPLLDGCRVKHVVRTVITLLPITTVLLFHVCLWVSAGAEVSVYMSTVVFVSSIQRHSIRWPVCIDCGYNGHMRSHSTCQPFSKHYGLADLSRLALRVVAARVLVVLSSFRLWLRYDQHIPDLG